MKQAFALTGYVPTSAAQALKARKAGTVEISPEIGTRDVFATVDGADVVEIRTGATSGEHTLVQLILKDKATVQTVIRTTASPAGVTRFLDPTIARLSAAATAKSILM